MSGDVYTQWLMGVKGVTVKRAHALMARFGGAEAVFKTPARELRAFANVPEAVVSALLANRHADDLAALADQLKRHGCTYVSMDNPRYPALLKTIDDAPPGLYVRGELPKPNMPAVAIIGSRRCSDYGLSLADRFARGLAARGVCVVSGLARGIDGKAHQGAIDAGGVTIAVLGNGLDVCYPPEHARLTEAVARHGCLVSEYGFGTPPEPYNFPARNRIVSGLCAAVLVVESEERSGTSITVAKALEQGRAVMAVPGSVFSRFSKGTNNLIYLGATPVADVDDVLFELRKELAAAEPIAPEEDDEENFETVFDESEKIVYACMGFEPQTLDELLRASGLIIQKLRHTLLQLELNGHIERLPGERYKKNR